MAETDRPSSAPSAETAPSVSPKIRDHLSDGSSFLKELGVAVPSWFSRLLFWWKHLGLKHALAVFSVFILPALNSQWSAYLADGLVETASEYYGVDISVDKWSGGWFGAHAVAHDVVVKVKGPFAKAELFKADKISVDLSVMRRLRSGYWIKEIKVERPSLYLERTLSGRWNWEEMLGPPDSGLLRASSPDQTGVQKTAASTGSGSRGQERGGRLRAEHVEIRDLRIEWVERLPANSGSGLIQTTTATLFVDDVSVDVSRLGATDEDTSFSFDGRTADGVLSIAGRVAREASEPETHVTINLENVGAAAVARFSPNARLVPASGSVNGRVQLLATSDRLDCRANLELRNVTFVINPYAPIRPEDRQTLQQQLASFAVNGPAANECGATDEDVDYRLMPAVQSSVLAAAVQSAPASIRQAAADDAAFVKTTASGVDVSTAIQQDIARSAGRMLGGETGAIVEQLATQPSTQNAVTRGVKGVGRGIKRLFGG